jgi:hypothetical protein
MENSTEGINVFIILQEMFYFSFASRKDEIMRISFNALH